MFAVKLKSCGLHKIIRRISSRNVQKGSVQQSTFENNCNSRFVIDENRNTHLLRKALDFPLFRQGVLLRIYEECHM